MRVLHVVPSYLPATRYGGPIYSVHGLARAQAELGCSVEVLTTSVDGQNDSPVPLAQPVELEQVKIWYFASHWLRRLYFSWAMWRWLRANVQRFDVLHLHSVFLAPTNMAARAARRAGVPYVLAPRGMLVPELIQSKSRWLKRAWIALFERATLARAAAVHVTSKLELSRMLELNLPMPATFVLANGVRVQRSEMLQPPDVDARGEHCWVYLGRIDPKKNLEAMVQAFAQVCASHPGLRLELIGGCEDARYLHTLKEQLVGLNIFDRVCLRGELHGQEKWRALQRAQLLILVSVNENFGNAAAEAMLLGVPVLVSEGVGISEWVAPAQAGWVCAADPQSIARAMQQICANDAQRVQYGANAERLARAEFAWNAIAEASTARYAELILQHKTLGAAN